MAKYLCRVRKYRKSARLSQRELALLVGLHSQGAISEIEAGLKRPGTSVAHACTLVFGAGFEDLFPGLHAQAERLVRAGVRKVQRTAAQPTARTFLAAVAGRLGAAARP